MTTKGQVKNIALTSDIVRNYRALRLTALRHIRDYDLSEVSFQRMLHEGLVPLEDLMRYVARFTLGRTTEDVEAAFIMASRAIVFNRAKSRPGPLTPGFHPTIAGLLSLAQTRHERLDENILVLLKRGGAQIQAITGCLVPSDPIHAPLKAGGGEHKFQFRFASCMRELAFALLHMGIFADDLLIYDGIILPGMMRRRPYRVIDIPRINKQIAVCDQIGQPIFVAQTIKPLPFWTASSNSMLQAEPDIEFARYDPNGGWLNRIRDLLLGDGIAIVDNKRFHKVPIPQASEAPLLDKETLIRWIKFFYEKNLEEKQEGRWPTPRDKTVWDKDVGGRWVIVLGESWAAIDKNLRIGGARTEHLNAKSLADFREKNQLGTNLRSEERMLDKVTLIRWIKFFYEREERWPTWNDKTVWDKDAEGGWIEVAGESWATIVRNFNAKGARTRHLGADSLTDFRIKNNLGGDIRSRRRRPKVQANAPRGGVPEHALR